LFNAAVPLLLLALLEIAPVAVARLSWLPAPSWLLGLERQAYLARVRNIQYDRECARYDPEVTYTLRPGTCVFANDEFSVRVDVNRLGLRDDELSLEAPEIVVLGDSFAMGWGVEQDETFAQLLAKRTGLRVLNAGISSYATARELLTLGRIDTSRLRLIVIQYCRDNDYPENRTFVENGGRLPIMPREAYEALVDQSAQRGGYWLGRNLEGLLKAASGDHPIESPKPDAPSEARTFLDVLRYAPVDLSHVPILLLELDGYGGSDDEFLDAVDAALAAGEAPGSGWRVRTLRLRRSLKRRHFYRLDPHLNAAGHRAVADLILEVLPELGITVGPSAAVPGT